MLLFSVKHGQPLLREPGKQFWTCKLSFAKSLIVLQPLPEIAPPDSEPKSPQVNMGPSRDPPTETEPALPSSPEPKRILKEQRVIDDKPSDV